jgi:uncharacterized protein (TIGR00297 family)
VIDLWMRVAIAAAVALLLAGAAWRVGALSRGGAIAAFAVGWLSCNAGWPWAIVLLVFFVSGSALSRLPSRVAGALAAIVEKGAVRDPAQVLANGGVFAAAALGSAIWPDPRWALAGVGALAAACADTWATEFGTRFGGVPRHVLTWRAVPAGTSGAVTVAGLAASFVGAFVIALSSSLVGLAAVVPVVLAGFGGALLDTLLGATLQCRRWCDVCDAATERRIHDCGTRTREVGGVALMTNDTVNCLATLAGAGLALAIS